MKIQKNIARRIALGMVLTLAGTVTLAVPASASDHGNWSVGFGFGGGHACSSDYSYRNAYDRGREDGFRTGFRDGRDDADHGGRAHFHLGRRSRHDAYDRGFENGYERGYDRGYEHGDDYRGDDDDE